MMEMVNFMIVFPAGVLLTADHGHGRRLIERSNMALSGSRGSRSRHSEPATSASSDHGASGHSRVRACAPGSAAAGLSGQCRSLPTYALQILNLALGEVYLRLAHATSVGSLLRGSAVFSCL
jgi:hypothetical protein